MGALSLVALVVDKAVEFDLFATTFDRFKVVSFYDDGRVPRDREL